MSGLPAGLRRITLAARERFGRTGHASVVVRLRAARPLFVTLRGPRKLRRSARSLQLTVSSSLAATLAVRVPGLRAQRFTVSRRTRLLRVHTPGGRRRLTVRLTLASGGLTRIAILGVPRAPR